MEEEKLPEQVEEKPHFSFPVGTAIFIGILMLLIIVCFIVVMILGPEDPVTSSSQISVSSL